MVVQNREIRAPNGGVVSIGDFGAFDASTELRRTRVSDGLNAANYQEIDIKYFYDPLDERRPAADIAMPTREDVEIFHLSAVTNGYEGVKDSDIRRLDIVSTL
jgi:hypothetical protein